MSQIPFNRPSVAIGVRASNQEQSVPPLPSVKKRLELMVSRLENIYAINKEITISVQGPVPMCGGNSDESPVTPSLESLVSQIEVLSGMIQNQSEAIKSAVG